MLTSPRTHWARTRLTPFCLTWGERVASRTAAAVALEEENTLPHLRLDDGDDEKTVVRRPSNLEH